MKYIEFIKKNWFLPVAIIAVTLIMFMSTSGLVGMEYPVFDTDNGEQFISDSTGSYYIEVLGQVKNPGVYEINKEMLVIEAIVMAGGFTEDADQYYIHKNISLSKNVTSSQKIFIPGLGENSGISQYQDPANININTASREQLMAVSGIGEVTADKIIASRPYGRLEDLQEISGMRKDVIEKLLQIGTL